MDNYSQVFADTLALYQSPYVAGDEGDAGKGQVTARAVYTIYSTMNPNIGYIGKNPGQTQYYGIAVDACQDKSDGYGADYLTDELQPDGRRLIKLAYTAYPTPASPPNAGWVQPTSAMLEHPGPLVLKGTAPPDPAPGPQPPDNLPPMPEVWSTEEDYTLQWYADTFYAMDAIYLNLLWRPVDMGGMNNWMFHVRENDWAVEDVTSAIMQGDEYRALHNID